MIRDLFSLGPARRRPEWGALVLRLFVGLVLIWGTWDNVTSAARMAEFRDFLAANGFPAPLASAYLSAYTQFACGVLILVGALVRQAALVMVVNFVVAVGMVHVGLPFEANIAPLAMLAGAAALVFLGAGPVSVDAAVERRRARSRTPDVARAPVGLPGHR